MQNTEIDAADLRILNHLQSNARASNAELAEVAFLSASQCYRRVKRLEESGVIKGYMAEVDSGAVGLDISAFVHINLGKHGGNPAHAFVDAITNIDEILECYSLTGDTDYLIRVTVPNLPAFSDFLMNKILPLPMISDVKSYIVLEEVRKNKALPLDHLAS